MIEFRWKVIFMTELEALENEAHENNIDIIKYPFESSRIKALYCDGTVALNSQLDSGIEKKCILAEEIGHHYTASGNILGSDHGSRKQEARGRIYAYEKLIGLSGLIGAYRSGCRSLFEIAEFLEVTESFLQEAIERYRQKYGICTVYENYVIYFEPGLGVLKMI